MVLDNIQDKLGPGTWYCIHMLGAFALTEDKVVFFCQYIRTLQKKFWCDECSEHFGEYLDNHPPEKSLNMFLWTWEFHNSVNIILGKSEMPYQTARSIYIDHTQKMCQESKCSNPKTKN